MSEHTPGKLYARELDLAGWVDIVTTDPDGTRSLPFIACKHHDPEANARRLVACWNACEGISTEDLESERSASTGWVRTASKLLKATTERDSLRAVNAELLEALEGLVSVYDAMNNPRGPKRIIADAAIASARKQESQHG